MDFEVWKEAGKTGQIYHVFYGLRTSDEVHEAVKIVASERKVAKLNLLVHQACVVNGKELWIDGYKKGAKRAIAITRR